MRFDNYVKVQWERRATLSSKAETWLKAAQFLLNDFSKKLIMLKCLEVLSGTSIPTWNRLIIIYNFTNPFALCESLSFKTWKPSIWKVPQSSETKVPMFICKQNQFKVFLSMISWALSTSAVVRHSLKQANFARLIVVFTYNVRFSFTQPVENFFNLSAVANK